MNQPQDKNAGSLQQPGYAPLCESFTLLSCDDNELQAMHICTLAIERHIGHDPAAKHRVAEYIKNRYGT